MNLKKIKSYLVLNKEEVNQFRNSHKKKLTKIFHFISLLGFSYGYLMLYRKNKNLRILLLSIIILYIFTIPKKLLILYLGILIVLGKINVGLSSVGIYTLIICSYLLTDISHYIADEKTYSSKYKNDSKSNFIGNKIRHHLYLPLLIMDSIIFKNLPLYFNEIEIDNSLIEYIEENNQNTNHRFTNKDIDFDYNINVDNIIKLFLDKNKLDKKYVKLSEIDELYITNCKKKPSSLEKVVDNYHIDGHIPNLFGLNTYRILILLQKDKNDKSKTCFKSVKVPENTNITIFDYNGQIHKADLDNENDSICKNRVLLKLHFITYPKNLSNKYVNFYKKYLIKTNRNMRNRGRKDKNYNKQIVNIFNYLKRESLRPIEII